MKLKQVAFEVENVALKAGTIAGRKKHKEVLANRLNKSKHGEKSPLFLGGKLI